MPVLVLLIIGVFAWHWLSESSAGAVTAVVLVVVGVLVALIFAAGLQSKKEDEQRQKRLERSKERRSAQREYVRTKAIPYQEILARKRKQLITVDDYGDTENEKWKKELVQFFNSKVQPMPANIWSRTWQHNISPEEICEVIDTVAQEGQNSNPHLFSYDLNMSGIEYEHCCAELLEQSGWKTVVSKASGDQGVDLIAQKGRVSVAIQCKKYSAPVGNKAVQEVVSGSLYYATEHAAVVTDNTYTAAARELANASNVLLLHHSELTTLEDRLIRYSANPTFFSRSAEIG